MSASFVRHDFRVRNFEICALVGLLLSSYVVGGVPLVSRSKRGAEPIFIRCTTMGFLPTSSVAEEILTK